MSIRIGRAVQIIVVRSHVAQSQQRRRYAKQKQYGTIMRIVLLQVIYLLHAARPQE